MTTKQKTAKITKLIELHDKLDYEWSRLIAVIGNHDMPLHDASWLVFDAYVEAVAREIGDEFSWLKWYIFDNECGLKCLAATAGYGEKPKPIRSIADLLALIDCKAP